MMKTQKKISNNLVIGLIGLAVIAFSAVGLVIAYDGGNPTNVIENCSDCSVGSQEFGGLGAATFADGDVTNLTDLDIADEFRVGGEVSLNATTTLQEITLGSRFSDTITVSTTTGGLASIQNTGARKICTRVELDIRVAPDYNRTNFSVTTSTSATVVTYGGSLIASSTVATNTDSILNNVDNIGTNVLDSWEWNHDVYILASMIPEPGFASTTDYDAVSGGLYVTCHTE